ncbi:MAG: CopG family transcriptional regulator [Actinobacteria bacterium]|nr:CopG family transcriptional regulator [Actinomycetota bacterium]
MGVIKVRETVTISLTEEMKKKLDEIASRENVNRSEIIKTALKQYFSILEFRRVRNLMIPKAEKSKIFSEDDVYRIVS